MKNNIPEGSCVCSVCGETKDNSCFTFYRYRINQRGEKAGQRLRVNTNCKECSAKRAKTKNKLEHLVKHLKPLPGSQCQCCGKPTQKFEFDHCHSTNVFRGYVCKDCNVGFGKFGDNTRGLIKAMRYLFKSISPGDEKEVIRQEIRNICG